jgi:sugar O-acyltransferase (sialic acid O-acetyltransferase NeuD family)
MQANDVILIGCFHEIIELCEICGKEIVGIIDDNSNNIPQKYTWLGTDGDIDKIALKYKNIPLIVVPDSPIVREKLVRLYSKYGFQFCNLIHPQSNISPSAKVGNGVVIQYGVNVSSDVTINDFVKINTFANVMHDVNIGAFTTIAPNAVLLGKVKISDGCYIGANSTILPNIEIGAKSIVGAGAVVTKNILPDKTVAGVPAKEMYK